jgi:hypothetical protein
MIPGAAVVIPPRPGGCCCHLAVMLVLPRALLVPLLLAGSSSDGAGAAATLPEPVAFWTFQEPTGAPRLSTNARHSYALTDGDASHPVEATASGGLFGPRAANFTAASPTQRLRVERRAAPALTSELAGPDAVVTVVAWVKRPRGRYFYGFLAGVWCVVRSPFSSKRCSDWLAKWPYARARGSQGRR